MQTITLQVQDSFIPDLLNYLEQFKNKITIQKDKNLELDPYFYQRQKQLQQDIEDIDNGKVQMLSQEQYNIQMNNFFKELKYDN